MSRSVASKSVLLAAGCVAAYFLVFTVGSLRAEFTHDDLMNGYRGWSYSLPSLLADNLLFFRFTPMYRPFGALVYKVFFAPFGFDLLPLRVFLLVVLAGSVFLVYRLAQTLSGSQEVGLFAALLSSYHGKFGQLYYNSGTLYDILCFFFYFAGLVVYTRTRSQGKNLSAFHLVIVCALYVLALDSKELAVSFPLALLAYELLWHPPAFHPPALWRWVTKQALPIWTTAAITTAFVMGRVFFQESSISTIGDYRMTVSAGEYFSKVAHYLNDASYAKDWLGPTGAAGFVVVLLAMAAVSRSRALLWGTVLFVGGLLPMAFIHARALTAISVPLAGLAVCIAVVLGFICSGLRRLSQREALQQLAFWLVFAVTGLLLIWFHPHAGYFYRALQKGEYAQIREAREQLQLLHPRFPSNSRILIVETPFPQYSPGYNNMFLIRLAYRDESLIVEELAAFEENRQSPDLLNYDYVLSFEDGRWVDVDPATLALKPPG